MSRSSSPVLLLEDDGSESLSDDLQPLIQDPEKLVTADTITAPKEQFQALTLEEDLTQQIAQSWMDKLLKISLSRIRYANKISTEIKDMNGSVTQFLSEATEADQTTKNNFIAALEAVYDVLEDLVKATKARRMVSKELVDKAINAAYPLLDSNILAAQRLSLDILKITLVVILVGLLTLAAGIAVSIITGGIAVPILVLAGLAIVTAGSVIGGQASGKADDKAELALKNAPAHQIGVSVEKISMYARPQGRRIDTVSPSPVPPAAVS